ncbi:MAG: hypothetical protein IT289_04185 [Oligoflexia bacterium]|nr:hypothetical protein [Oligoflexia bacterium]
MRIIKTLSTGIACLFALSAQAMDVPPLAEAALEMVIQDLYRGECPKFQKGPSGRGDEQIFAALLNMTYPENFRQDPQKAFALWNIRLANVGHYKFVFDKSAGGMFPSGLIQNQNSETIFVLDFGEDTFNCRKVNSR